MEASIIVKKADDFVFKKFKSSDNNHLLYHDYKHTFDVVSAVIEIGNAINLNTEDLELLQLAAWFHDVGYIEKQKGHEKLSAESAISFLEKENYDKDKIAKIVGLIEVTEMGKEPQDYLQEVMCDADLLKIGTKDYSHRSALLRGEAEELCDIQMNDLDWLEWELKFLYELKYYTRYATLNYDPIKNDNIILRKNEVKKLKKQNEEILSKSKVKNEKTVKNKSPERGIETMFRVTLKNHISLSAIADNKANLMLSVNAIIISITISVLIENYIINPALNVPSVFLLTVSVLTIIFATLSTKPSVTKGVFTKEDVLSKKANLLFFGNFYNTPIQEYEWGVNEMMKDKDFLYGAMIRDLHSLGKVLNKKYYYLRITYLLFMYGITLSVILFVIFMSFNIQI